MVVNITADMAADMVAILYYTELKLHTRVKGS
jgi:hypothetical protein